MVIKELHRAVNETIGTKPKSIDSPQEYADAEKFLKKCDRMSDIVRNAFRPALALAERKKELARIAIMMLEDKIQSFTDPLDQASLKIKLMMQDRQAEGSEAIIPISTGITP